MVTKFYSLKEVIEYQLTRIEDKNLKITKSIHIDHITSSDETRDYYQVTIVSFSGKSVVV